MKIKDIITLEDNLDYLILDIITKNNHKYIYSVILDPEENPTNNYKYFELITEDNEDFIEEIEDEQLLKEIAAELTKHYLAMSSKKSPEN